MLAEAWEIVHRFALYAGGLIGLWAVGVAFGLTAISFPLRMNLFNRCLIAIEVLLVARATWWVYVQDGAEVIARHHLMFRIPRSETGVKILLGAIPCAVLIAFATFGTR